jgi:hypothetical protein
MGGGNGQKSATARLRKVRRCCWLAPPRHRRPPRATARAPRGGGAPLPSSLFRAPPTPRRGPARFTPNPRLGLQMEKAQRDANKGSQLKANAAALSIKVHGRAPP